MHGGTVWQEYGFLGNCDDTLAQGRSVNSMERDVVDSCVHGRFWEGIEEFKQEGNKAGLAAAGPSADGNFRAGVDGKLNVAKGESGRIVGSILSSGITPGEH